MDNPPLFFGVGLLIGAVLFFACERAGLLHKWSGLKPPPSAKAADSSQRVDEKKS